ncbi:MAG: hypothetical protein LCH91_13990 [Bacteroidetes bacterium]|nr:hypothetical protein [Bacteroidota bacterium]
MRHWFKSEIHPNCQVYVELEQKLQADGFPKVEPRLLGFVQALRSVEAAYVFEPEQTAVAVSENCTVWQAKMAIQNKIKDIENAKL